MRTPGSDRQSSGTSRRDGSKTGSFDTPSEGKRFRIARFSPLIQIKAAADSSFTVREGNGPDAVQFQNRENYTACPPLATTRMDGRAASVWKSLRFCF
jgi:hypothetical protein